MNTSITQKSYCSERKNGYGNSGAFRSYQSPKNDYNKSMPEELRFEEDLQKVKQRIEDQKRNDFKMGMAKSVYDNSMEEDERNLLPPELDESALSEDARRIVEKYYPQDEAQPYRDESEDINVRTRLEDIEAKSDSIGKLIKTLLKGSGQSNAVQQFNSVNEEAKMVYEGYIQNLEVKNDKLELMTQNFQKGFKEIERELINSTKEKKRIIKRKDEEITNLHDQIEMMEEEINKLKTELRKTKDENTDLAAEVSIYNETTVSSNDMKGKQIIKLNNEISDLNASIKDKKKELSKNSETIRCMNKEISELKRKLSDQSQKIQELNETLNDSKNKLEDQKKIVTEVMAKSDKVHAKKVIIFN